MWTCLWPQPHLATRKLAPALGGHWKGSTLRSTAIPYQLLAGLSDEGEHTITLWIITNHGLYYWRTRISLDSTKLKEWSMTSVLVCLGCCNKYHRPGDMSTGTEFPQLCRLEVVSSRGRRAERVLWGPLYKDTNPFTWALPSWPPHLLTPSPWELGFNVWIFKNNFYLHSISWTYTVLLFSEVEFTDSSVA